MLVYKLIEKGPDLEIVPTGRLDTTTAPRLEADIRKLIAGVEILTFDFTKLEYISSADLSLLLSSLVFGSIQEKLKQSSLSGVYMPEVLLTASSVKAIKRKGNWTIENTSKSERELFKALSMQVGAELKQASFGLLT